VYFHPTDRSSITAFAQQISFEQFDWCATSEKIAGKNSEYTVYYYDCNLQCCTVKQKCVFSANHNNYCLFPCANSKNAVVIEDFVGG